MSSWYASAAPQDDIVVSTRIRLARNLSGMPFPARMSGEQRRELNARVKKAITESNTPFAKSLKNPPMAIVSAPSYAAYIL